MEDKGALYGIMLGIFVSCVVSGGIFTWMVLHDVDNKINKQHAQVISINQGLPWLKKLSDGIVSHQDKVYAENKVGLDEAERKEFKHENPELFAMPLEWFDAVVATPELTTREIQWLITRAESEPYLSSDAGLVWIKDVHSVRLPQNLDGTSSRLVGVEKLKARLQGQAAEQ